MDIFSASMVGMELKEMECILYREVNVWKKHERLF